MLKEVYDAFKKVMDGQEERLMRATKKYVERKRKEIEEAAARKDEPVVFSSAFTRTLPFFPAPRKKELSASSVPRLMS